MSRRSWPVGARGLPTMLMALALVALPTGWTPALHAQEGEEADLTLDEALEIALQYNPGMRRAMND